MPYKKDGIGQSPYYVLRTMTKSYFKNDCKYIQHKMESIGIQVHKKKTNLGCELTFLDIYDEYSKSLLRKPK
jgi:hypothetical protein